VREIRTLGLMWRELETEPWDGLRHRLLAKAAGNGYSPSPEATAPVLDPTGNRWGVATKRKVRVSQSRATERRQDRDLSFRY
jgi:hypothetical protein